MLNLIRADLYRITRPRGLRGSFWQYGIAIIAAYGIVAGLVAFANSPMYYDMARGTIGDVASKASLTVYFSDMMSGLVPLCVSFMAVEHALAEFKNGYVKSVLSARAGRLSYFASHVVFAGVLSALVIAFATVVVALCMPILMAGDISFAAVDGPVEIIGWFAGFWLNTWALAALSLIMVYATRVSPVSYIAAFCFNASLVPQTLMGLAFSTGGALRVLQPIRPVLETLAAWMPSTALSNLGQGGQLFLHSDLGVWGAVEHAFMIAPGPQTILTGVIWIVLATLLVLTICRKRDI